MLETKPRLIHIICFSDIPAVFLIKTKIKTYRLGGRSVINIFTLNCTCKVFEKSMQLIYFSLFKFGGHILSKNGFTFKITATTIVIG